MLAAGRPYMEIIRYLNGQGFPGFNKVNLNAWKKTGFRQWLRPQNRNTSETDQPVLEGDQQPVVTDTNR